MRQKLPHERTRREPTLRDPTLMPRSLAEALEPTRAPKAPRRIRSRGEPGRFSGLLAFSTACCRSSFLWLPSWASWRWCCSQPSTSQVRSGTRRLLSFPKARGCTRSPAASSARGSFRTAACSWPIIWLSGSTATHADGKPIQLKAGEFEIRKHASLRQVLDTLIEGRADSLPHHHSGRLDQRPDRRAAEGRAEPAMARSRNPAGGTLLPDTFKFSRGMARQELIDRMRTEQQRLLATRYGRSGRRICR